MLNSGDRHLTDEELDALVGFETGSASTIPSRDAHSKGVVRHLSGCHACRLRVEKRAAVDGKLATLKDSLDEGPGSQCPDREEWTNLAAGLTDQWKAEQLLDHAVECNHCGPLLRALMHDFSDSSSPEEMAILARLESTRLVWQQELAARFGGSHIHDSRKLAISSASRTYFPPWRWNVAGAACFLLIATAIWFVFPRPQAHVQQLMAEAYAEQRTVEMRIPGAKYGPIRIERGQQSSHFNRPAPLLEAEALIARKLAENPADPFWLQNRARTELLEGNYAGAIETLQQARSIDSRSASLLTDLATAYFQRAEALDRPADFGVAMDLLMQSLDRDPRDPTALFNRALVGERLFLYTRALKDWQDYLQLDPTGPWAEEARKRMKKLQDALQKQAENRSEHLLDPMALNAQLINKNRATHVLVDQKIEAYYHTAIVDWLPAAFPLKHTLPDAHAVVFESALFSLSEISNSQHADDWFSDFLSRMTDSSFSSAVGLLANAKRASDSGDFASARTYSVAAKKEFHRARNIPGELRAALEEVYALRLSQQGMPCARETEHLMGRLKHTNYRWLTAQLQLERAICLDIIGEHDRAMNFARQAVEATDKYRYGDSHLRALLVFSVLSSPSTDALSKWTSDLSGLRRFWEGPYSAMRGYSFYTDLDALAEKAGQSFLEVAILQQAIQTLGPDPDILLKAMVHSRLAGIALRAGMPTLSSAEYVEANTLFRSAPESDATRNGKLETETWLARIELLNHQYLVADQRLSSMQSAVAGVSNQFVILNFYQTLADARLRSNDLLSAEKPIRASIAVAEHGLLALRTENDRLLWNRESESAYRTLVEWSFREGRNEDSLELWEWYRGAYLRDGSDWNTAEHVPRIEQRYQDMSFADISAPPSLPAPDVVARNLTELDNQTDITYAVFQNGVVLWSYDNRGVDARWITIETRSLTQKVHDYVTLCANPRSDVSILRTKSRELYDLLIAPISDRLVPNRTLVIEPDGILSDIPFGALLDRSDTFLADIVPIVISPGSYHSRSRKPYVLNNESTVLIVGSPAIGTLSTPSLESLPDATLEAQSIATQFHRARLLLGAQATLPAVQGELSKSEIFHFAGHAVSSAGDVRLLLAPTDHSNSDSNGLGVEQLDPRRLRNLQLVVLSACGTENSPNDSLADPTNLVSAFLRANVPHVIAARWNVDSASTALLMDRFYDRLLQGESIPRALQAAGAGFRKNPGKSHPYFWAAFDSFGRA